MVQQFYRSQRVDNAKGKDCVDSHGKPFSEEIGRAVDSEAAAVEDMTINDGRTTSLWPSSSWTVRIS